MKFIFGVFIVLHGLVHLLYAGQSAKYFELKPGMIWPDGSWAFSRLLGNDATRNLASISLLLAAVALISSGIGIFTVQPWWRPLVVGATVFSSTIYMMLWDGRMQDLDGQGAVGLFINVMILASVLILRWPIK